MGLILLGTGLLTILFLVMGLLGILRTVESSERVRCPQHNNEYEVAYEWSAENPGKKVGILRCVAVDAVEPNTALGHGDDAEGTANGCSPACLAATIGH